MSIRSQPLPCFSFLPPAACLLLLDATLLRVCVRSPWAIVYVSRVRGCFVAVLSYKKFTSPVARGRGIRYCNTRKIMLRYSKDYDLFKHQVWQTFVQSQPDDPTAEWSPMGWSLKDKHKLLSREANYGFLMDHFCESANLNDFPNASGLHVSVQPSWAKLNARYVNGCPSNDPAFAERGKMMLASGLGCLAPSKCVPAQWLEALEQHFRTHSKNVTKEDLYQPDVCNIPYGAELCVRNSSTLVPQPCQS